MPSALNCNRALCCGLFLLSEIAKHVSAKDYYQTDFCVSRSNGSYTDPEDCRTYYDCSNHVTYHKTNLQTGTMFNPDLDDVSYAWDMQCPISKVIQEVWNGITGDNVRSLVKNKRFPCEPNRTSFIDTFCLYKPTGYGDNYGQRLASCLRAPVSGPYIFETSCDNTCQVWLSTDETPDNKQRIIDQKRWKSRDAWKKMTEQVSRPVHLRENKVYYLELRHKEGVGSDFVCLGVKIPGMGKPERPISSRHLIMPLQYQSWVTCGRPIVSPTARPEEDMMKYLKRKTEDLKNNLTQSPPAGKTHSEHVLHITKEYSNLVDSVLQDNHKIWQSPNASSAMEIALITEDFGRVLAESWNNQTAPLVVTSSSLALQVADLKDGYYRFPAQNLSSQDGNWTNVHDFMEIRLTAKNPSSRSSMRFFSVLYKNLNEFVPQSAETLSSKSAEGLGLKSRIISSLVTSSSEQLDMLVSFHLRNIKNNHSTRTEPVCSWWELLTSNSSQGGQWSASGCAVTSQNLTHTTCTCNHLTNFAVLMQVKDGQKTMSISYFGVEEGTGNECQNLICLRNELHHKKDHTTITISKSHQMALSIITYVGCALSLVGVSITVLIFSCMTGLWSERNLIHLNLSLSIGIVQVIFLAGIEATTNKVVCRAVAVLLHYFCLVSFAWMLVESIFLYIMVVKVFQNDKAKMKLYLGCSYGLPAVLVIISTSIAHTGYGTETICWLSMEDGVIYAFVAPVLVCILVNTVILFLVIKEIVKVQKNNTTGNTAKITIVRSGIKSVIVLLPLLGITWVFGVLALSEDAIVLQYLFAICNSLQGFFIFIFHCVLNSEVRKALGRKREIWSSQHAIFLSPGSLAAASSNRSGNSFGKSTDGSIPSNASEMAAKSLSISADEKPSSPYMTNNNGQKYRHNVKRGPGTRQEKVNRVCTLNVSNPSKTEDCKYGNTNKTNSSQISHKTNTVEERTSGSSQKKIGSNAKSLHKLPSTNNSNKEKKFYKK